MIEIIVEADMTASGGGIDFAPNMGKKKKRKYETFKVSDDVFSKFRNGKTKFERWSKYLDLSDSSQKKIYDYAKKHHNGVIILQNATTGAIRGVRFNRNGGGQWGRVARLKEQVLNATEKFTRLNEDVLDIMRNIVKKQQMQRVKFKDGKSASIDMFTASAMTKVYDALNKDNQTKFKDMINKDKKSFMAMQAFAMKSVK
tara:strand:+ start:2129 stop:2728 length:600 start_codon:yes stop_codon:yes gene_type:complete